jgi:hypothetical protein
MEQQRIATANSIPITQEDFQTQWPLIIKNATASGDLFLKAILESGNATLHEAKIRISVRSKVEESKILDSASWLNEQFRTHFSGRQPAIFIILEEPKEEGPVMFGTGAKSKFGRMAELNPSLIQLRDILDLELLY